MQILFQTLPTMPRSKTGRKREPVNKQSVEYAAKRVLDEELSIREAAIGYKVSKTTLTRHLAKYKKQGNEGEFKYNVKYNTMQIFTTEEELCLEQYLITAAHLHYGLTKKDVRYLAYQYAFLNKKKMPDSWNNNKIAGKGWLRYFLARHGKISLRKPEATSLARSTSFNKENVALFFKNYKEVLSRRDFPAHRIWNCDETGLTTVHVPPKILSPKGVKQVGQMTSGERGQNTTVIAAVSASGIHIPPMMIFPRVKFQAHMLKGAPVGTIGGANSSGWSNEVLFLQFLGHFKRHTQSSGDNPVLLLLDNHESHISVDAIEFCRNNGIYLVTFHPHTSHKIQPLDRTVFGPLKTYYNAACSEWMATHAAQPISIYDIGELFGKAFPKAFTTSNILKGFQVSGLYPVDENIFQEHEFLSSYVTDRPFNVNFEHNTTEHASPVLSTISEQTQKHGAEVLQPVNGSNVPFTKSDDEIFLPLMNNDRPSTSAAKPTTEISMSDLQTNICSTSANISPHPTASMSFEMIRPFPKAGARKTKRGGRPKGKSRILTDTPEKNEVVLNKENALLKKNKQRVTKRIFSKSIGNKPLQEKVTKKQKSDNFDSAFIKDIESVESSSDMEAWEDEILQEQEEILVEQNLENEDISKGDYLLVKVPGKKLFYYYVAEVVFFDDNNQELRYLRRFRNTNKFLNDDSTTFAFQKQDVVAKLPKPISVGGTARSARMLRFGIEFGQYNPQ